MVANAFHISDDGEHAVKRIYLGRGIFHGKYPGNPPGQPGIVKVNLFLAFLNLLQFVFIPMLERQKTGFNIGGSQSKHLTDVLVQLLPCYDRYAKYMFGGQQILKPALLIRCFLWFVRQKLFGNPCKLCAEGQQKQGCNNVEQGMHIGNLCRGIIRREQGHPPGKG